MNILNLAVQNILDLIKIPIVDANEAVVLIKQLLTAGKAEGPLPKIVAPALARLEENQVLLEKELHVRAQLGQSKPPSAKNADKNVDRAWSAFHEWLISWAYLEDEEQDSKLRQGARTLYERIFPEKLTFLKLTYKKEWAESARKLQVIEDQGYEKIIKSLGGMPFLNHLRKCHEAYGEALHITSTIPERPSPADVRGQILETLDALRTYIIKVVALIEPNDEPSQKLAQRLLRPLSEWPSRRVTPRSEDASQPTPSAEDKPHAEVLPD